MQTYTVDLIARFHKKSPCTKVTIPAAVGKTKPSPAEAKAAKEKAQREYKDPRDDPYYGVKLLFNAAQKVDRWWNEPLAPKAKAPAPAAKTLDPFDLQDLPAAMEAAGFKVYAQLQRKWFAGARYEFSSIQAKKGKNIGPLHPTAQVDTDTVRLAELLKLSRVKEAFDAICDEAFLNSARVRESMARVINAMDDGTGGFNNSNKSLQYIHRHCMVAQSVACAPFPQRFDDIRTDQAERSGTAAHDVEMALGQVTFYAAIQQCRIDTQGGRRHALVEKIVVYMMAPFCFDAFEGTPQYRGHWNKKQIALVTHNGQWVQDPVYTGSDMYAKNAVLWPIHHADMRQWRAQHDAGGDMLVFSDTHRPRHDPIQLLVPYATEEPEGVSVLLTPLELAAVLQGGTIERESSTTVRLWGAVTMVAGAAEMIGATALMITPEPTMLTKVGGVALGAHGADTLNTGWKQVLNGQDQVTYTQQTMTTAAASLGATPALAMAIGMGIDLSIGVLDGSAIRALRLTGVRGGLIDIQFEKVVNRESHIAEEHIARSDRYLRERLIGTHMPAATSFSTEREASIAISQTLKQNIAPIQAWVQSRAIKGVFVGEMSSPVGYGVIRSTGLKQQGFTKVRIVLKRIRHAERDFFILTGFPIP